MQRRPHGSGRRISDERNCFQANCLRKMLGIKAAFWSIVSNEQVRQIVRVQPLSRDIRKSQLILFGRILTDPGKQYSGPHVPVTTALLRRVGRPWQTWTGQLLQIARQHAGEGLDTALASKNTWREADARIIRE